MPDRREQIVWLAEFLGWEVRTEPVPENQFGNVNYPYFDSIGDLITGPYRCRRFDPFASWDDAALLQAEMEKRGYWLKLASPCVPGDSWDAGFMPHLMPQRMHEWRGRVYYGSWGNTGPEAIANAALAFLDLTKAAGVPHAQ